MSFELDARSGHRGIIEESGMGRDLVDHPWEFAGKSMRALLVWYIPASFSGRLREEGGPNIRTSSS
jgi:hypothetical protein